MNAKIPPAFNAAVSVPMLCIGVKSLAFSRLLIALFLVGGFLAFLRIIQCDVDRPLLDFLAGKITTRMLDQSTRMS